MKKLTGKELAAIELGKLQAMLAGQAAGNSPVAQKMAALPVPAVEQEKPLILSKGQREAIAIIEAALLDINQSLLGIFEVARKARLDVPRLYIDASRQNIGQIWHVLDELQTRAESREGRLQ